MRVETSLLEAEQAIRVMFDISDGLVLWLDDRRIGTSAGERCVRLELTGPEPPADLVAVHVRGQIGLDRIDRTFEPAPNLTFEHVWDGRRPRTSGSGGPATSLLAELDVGWEIAARFPRTGRTRWWRHHVPCGGVDVRLLGCGGVTPAALHRLDVNADVLWRGDGSKVVEAQRRSSRAVDRLPVVRGELIVSDGDRAHVFDRHGNFRRTLSLLKGTVLATAELDEQGRISSWVDLGRRFTVDRRTPHEALLRSPAGVWAVVDFDETGRAVAVTDQSGSRVELEWTGGRGLASIIDPTGLITKVERDELGRIVRFLESGGRQLDLVGIETEAGSEVTVVTGEGRATTHVRREFADGATIETTSVAGVNRPRVVERRPVGLFGHELTVREPDGRVSIVRQSRSADAHREVVVTHAAVTDESGRTLHAERRTEHDRDGTTTELLSSAGSVWTKRLDDDATTLSSTSPEGRLTSVVVDPGQSVEIVMPGSATCQVDYDDQLRPSRMTRAGSRVMYGYDQNGRLTWTDYERWRQQVHHDDQGRVIAIETPGGWIRFSRAGTGAVRVVTAPHGAVTTIDRLPDGRIATIEYPGIEGGRPSVRFGYDLDGLLVERCFDESHRIEYRRDGVGRVSSIRTPDVALDVSYDPDTGRLTGLTTGDDGIEFGYEGPLVVAELATGRVAGGVERRYGEDGLLRARSVNRGRALPYGRDLDGMITSIGPLRLTRDGHGAIVETRLDELTTVRTYDGEGRLTTHTTTFGDTLCFSERIERDSLGRIIEIAERTPTEQRVTTYDYDNDRRLAQVEVGDRVVLTLAYDRNGNIAKLGRPQGAVTLHYDAGDRLTRVATAPATHDAAGNLVAIGQDSVVRGYRHDGLGRLIGFTDIRGVEAGSTRDALGRPIEMCAPGHDPVRLLWDGDRPAATIDDRDVVDLLFIDSGSEAAPEALVRDGSLYLLVADHRGSIRCVVNAHNGDIVQAIDYDALGQRISDTAPGWQPFGFAGRLQDPVTGLTSFGPRTYDPFLGRFLDRHPEGLAGGNLNLYQFAYGDPVNLDDDRRPGRRARPGLSLGRDNVIAARPLSLDWVYLRTEDWCGDLAVDRTLGRVGRLLSRWTACPELDLAATLNAATRMTVPDASSVPPTFDDPGASARPWWANANLGHDAAWSDRDQVTGARHWERDPSSWSADPGFRQTAGGVLRLANPIRLLPQIGSTIARLADR